MNMLNKSGRFPAWTLPELLAAMAVSGLILIFAYEGISLLQKRASEPESAMPGWEFIRNHAMIERLMNESDSVKAMETILLFYSKGISTDTIYVADNKLIYMKNGKAETLFNKMYYVRMKTIAGTQDMVKEIRICLPKGKQDSTVLHYSSASSNYLEALYRHHQNTY